MNNFFIVGAPRSGTTFIVKLLNIASNVKVFSEQSPKLGYEARERHIGHFKSKEDAEEFIRVQKEEHIRLVNEMGYVYGDKNPNYLPFVKDMTNVFNNIKFVFVYRDGRDVIRSLINWTYTGRKLFNMIDDIDGGDEYPIQNLWDYSRLRPRKGEKYYDEWKECSKFEKCCISWSYYNQYMLEICSEIDGEIFIKIDVSNSDIEDYKELFNFLSLSGANYEDINNIINSNINTSIKDNNMNYFNHYSLWSPEQKNLYEKYCGDTHIKLFGELKW